MSGVERIAVVGNGAFADSLAAAVRRGDGHELAGRVAPGSALPAGTSLVLSVAGASERIGVARDAVAAGLPVATLPLPTDDEASQQVLASGRVVQVSRLRGFAAVETLRSEVRRGALGQSYGVYATYRVRRGTLGTLERIGLPLLHLGYDLMTTLGETPASVQVTTANLFGSEPDAWFVIARGSGGFLATLEFGGLLAGGAGADEQVLVEATGSDAVLRAEPTRQAIQVTQNSGGSHELGWWGDLAERFADASLEAIAGHDAGRELGFLRLVGAIRQSAGSSLAVMLT